MSSGTRSFRLWLTLHLSFLLFAPTVSAVTIDWVTVGGAGNACDPQTQGCFGAVAYNYSVSKTEVTNAQYAEFLNAVADTDTNALYATQMAGIAGGITRSGTSGSYIYNTIGGRENQPVNYVSFSDSLRFANWLGNGQPTGPQGNATTDDGAYTITPAGILANSIVRNSGATIVLTSEDEWYKAAYFDAVSAGHLAYPANSNTPTTCSAPSATANTANCGPTVGNVVDVGSYPASTSPNGTLDQGGNVAEWNESIIYGTNRGMRGGSYFGPVGDLEASTQFSYLATTGQGPNIGFRVAMVPEPGTGLLVMTGLIGLAWRQNRCV